MNRADRNREALDHLRLAVEIDRRMAAADPHDLSATRKLFITYIMLGRVYRNRTGQQLAGLGEANATLEAAADLADKMAAADPNNNLALMDVVNARSGLGELLRQQNRMQAAVSARNLLMLGVRVSFAWKEPACSFPCGGEFSGQYVGVVPTIELIGEIKFHAL